MLAGRGVVQPSAAQLTLAVDISQLGLDPAGLVGNYAGDSVEFKIIGTCHFFYTPSSGQVRLKCRVDCALPMIDSDGCCQHQKVVCLRQMEMQ